MEEEEKIIIQSRELTIKDIEFIKQLIKENPLWSQRKLSENLCHAWNWRNDKGQIKDISCRYLLKKLGNRGYVILPKLKRIPSPGRTKHRAELQLPFFKISTAQSLMEVQPIKILNCNCKSLEGKLLTYLLAEHHYLGYKGSVGENLLYLIKDCNDCVLGCVVFGSAAWKVDPRDKYIGWDDAQRSKKLKLITNNMRFLLLPKIPHLASHILGQIAKRISKDWEEKYGHGIELLETFVEIGRFKGTCYKATNWVCVGETQGRSRNDRYNKLEVPIKHIYLYPIDKRFRERLCN